MKRKTLIKTEISMTPKLIMIKFSFKKQCANKILHNAVSDAIKGYEVEKVANTKNITSKDFTLLGLENGKKVLLYDVEQPEKNLIGIKHSERSVQWKKAFKEKTYDPEQILLPETEICIILKKNIQK